MDYEKAENRVKEIIFLSALFAEEKMHAPKKKLNETINRLVNPKKKKKK